MLLTCLYLSLFLIMAKTEEESHELKLRTMLATKGFTQMMRPTMNQDTTTQLKLDVVFRSIDDLNEKMQTLSSTMWVRIYWDSDVYTWNPADYGNITQIYYSPSDLWIPDLVLYNSADPVPLFATIKTPIRVKSDGSIQWMSPLKQTTACSLDITYYPFDSQECPFRFGLWTSTGSEVNMSLVSDSYVPEKNQLLPNGELNVVDITVKRHETFYAQSGLTFPDIQFNLRLQRRTKYYIGGLITPSLLLGVLGVLTFFLPAACGERVGFCVTTLLSLMVLLLVVTEQIPETSETSPIISQFLEVILGSLTASLVVSCLTLKFLFEDTEKVEDIGWFVRVFTNKWMATLMLVDCLNRNKESTNNTNKSYDTEMQSRTKGSAAGLQELVQKVRDMNESDACKAEYIKAAKVWDRFFIVMYLIIMLSVFVWLNLAVPMYLTP